MSGRDELLNEAIAKAKEAEDWQLADWLRMARGGESAARWYAEKLREIEAENAKLRELCKSMRCALVDFDDTVYLAALDDTLVGAGFDLQELGIEVDG